MACHGFNHTRGQCCKNNLIISGEKRCFYYAAVGMNEVKTTFREKHTPQYKHTTHTHTRAHNKGTGAGVAVPPLPVGAMNRTLSLIPSRHAALSPAPPSSRHVVGVKAWGVREKLGLKSATIHPLRR